MKRLIMLTSFLMVTAITTNHLYSQGILGRIKDKAQQKVDQKIDKGIDKGLDKPENDAKKKDGNQEENKQPGNDVKQTGNGNNDKGNNTNNTAAFKTYANYDFVPGNKIIFEDNFMTTPDGEFPNQWDLENGQAVVNRMGNFQTLKITEGNYGKVHPLVKSKSYLGNEFTIEYDHYMTDQSYGMMVFFNDAQGKVIGNFYINAGGVDVKFRDANGEGKSLSGSYPADMLHGNYFNKWHHIALAYKNKQIKIYADNTRVIVVPNSNLSPAQLSVGGIGSSKAPLILTNFRIAEGGGMNMLGKKFTDAKIITHGINFDYDKATIKPESMGTLNMIVQLMQENPDVKFEVGGHTDADGDDSYNLKLSQQRADAVRTQLISMGIDASKLTAKGYGKTKPVSDNNTPDGKANNRRVEFVKM